jgi:hypothetical protein
MTAGELEGVDDDSGIVYLVSDILETLFELHLSRSQGDKNNIIGLAVVYFGGWWLDLALSHSHFTTVIHLSNLCRIDIILTAKPKGV